MLAELSLYGMLMKLVTVKCTFILVMKLIQGFSVVFLIHSVNLCHYHSLMRQLSTRQPLAHPSPSAPVGWGGEMDTRENLWVETKTV